MRFSRRGWFVVCLVLAAPLPSPTFADPPQLTGPNGPPVQGLTGPIETVLFASERGLTISVSDLADLAPAYNDGTGETLPRASVPLVGTVPASGPGRYAADSGAYVFDLGGGAVAELSTLNSFGYRIFRTVRDVNVAVDGGVMVQARIGTSGAVLASAVGATVEAARALLLADAALDGIRHMIASAALVATAPTVSTTEANSSLLTGRDTYRATVITFGPEIVRTGNLGECATPLTGCEGGLEATLLVGTTNFNTTTLQDLYFTDTLTRTVTTVQNWFLNLTLADPLDPPQLTEGPLVQVGIRSIESNLLASERGLAIPVDELADLAPVYVIDGVENRIVLRDGSEGGGPGAPTFPAQYVADGGAYNLIGSDVVTTVFADSFGYRVFRTDRTVDVAVDGGDRVQARIGTTGSVLARAIGPTVEAAQAAVLADMALDGIRADIVRVEAVAAPPTVTVEEVTTSLLTGRDTYFVGVTTFGPSDDVIVGNLGLCTTPLTACEGGTQVAIDDGATHFNIVTLQDLYITDTLTRTVTTVQNWFLNIFLTGADGTPHVAAQGVGLAGAEGFLARMLAERRPVAPQVTSGALPDGPLAFAAFSGAQGTFDSIGGGAPSDWTSGQFTGGFTWAVSPDWTLGVAVEAGEWGWDGTGTTASGDSAKLGLFGTYTRGPLTFGLSGFVGRQGVTTEDAFGATSDYDVATRGLAAEVGYDLQQGAWTITPTSGLRLLQWDAPAVTDSLGNVTDAATVQQLRPELGVTLSRSLSLPQGLLDLSLDARVWTVSGDRTGVTSSGILTLGEETGALGGQVGLTADWTLGDGSTLTARVDRSFSEGGDETSLSLGYRMSF